MPSAEVAHVRHARHSDEARRAVLRTESPDSRPLPGDINLPSVAASHAEIVPLKSPRREVDEVRVAHARVVLLAPDAEAKTLLAGIDAGPDEHDGLRVPPKRQKLRPVRGIARLRETLLVGRVEIRLLSGAQERNSCALAGEHQLHG